MTQATRTQLTRLAVLFTQHGIADRRDRLRLCSDHVGRHLYTSAQMTMREAETLRHRLEALPPGVLPAALARLVAAEEARAAAAAWGAR